MGINNDDTLKRTMTGKNYKVKGYVITPFEVTVKALDEEEAEDFVTKETFFSKEERVEIEEVMEDFNYE